MFWGPKGDERPKETRPRERPRVQRNHGPRHNENYISERPILLGFSYGNNEVFRLTNCWPASSGEPSTAIYD